MKIYLAGSVPKGDTELSTFDNWRVRYQEALEKHTKAEFIDPYVREAKEDDFLLVTGLDCKHIKQSDIVIVNVEAKMGAGTSMELPIAKYFNIPVITVLPKDSYHRRPNVTFHGVVVKDWIHPFVHTFSDSIVESVDDIDSKLIDALRENPKDLTIIDKAIAYAERSTV
jgi:hypothetical protein